MSRRAQENLIAAVLFAVFAVFFWMSLGYGPRARLVPLPISAFGMFIIICQVIWQNVRSPEDLRINVLQLVAGREGTELAASHRGTAPPDAEQHDTLARNLAAFGIVGALLALFLVLGPLPAVFIFSFAYFSLSGHCSVPRALVYALACAGVIWGMFGFALNIQLNRGLAAPWIEQLVRF